MLDSQTLEAMKHKDFIDVGGFIGDSAVLFEREFCDKNIYTFEPTKENFRLLKRTLELNNSKRIIPINKGLGSESGTAQICINESSSSIVAHHSDEMKVAHIITLDSFVRENNIKVALSKLILRALR